MQDSKKIITRRVENDNVWLEHPMLMTIKPDRNHDFVFEVVDSEEAVGQAMLDELTTYANDTDRDIVVILLGGRGAQAMYRIINDLAKGHLIDGLLGRLHVFTQDALAPMRMDNGLSFVRDFERQLGNSFFEKIKSFTPMLTDSEDVGAALESYLEKLDSFGGIDIFYLGFGPEAEASSHLCYIKPNSGARINDVAGIIPISSSILEHHITKFKVGGSSVSSIDEAECRKATHILTLGPAAILGAKKVIQSIVDASTAPAKRASFARMRETYLEDDGAALTKQLDANPGLWIRLHDNVKSFVLPDLL